MATPYQYGPPPEAPPWMDPQQAYYWQQQQQQDAEQRQRQQQQDALQQAELQWQAGAQGVYNANAVGGMQNQVAGTEYSLYGDLSNQMLRSMGMQGDVLRQRRSDTQYQRGLQEQIAQEQHRYSSYEVPTNFGYAKRLLGY